jgi:hypothetical protein
MAFATASIALMGFGAVNNTFGSYFSAKNSKAALGYQAEIAETNAQIAELGARSELRKGQREEQRVRLNTAQLKSRQRTSLAANGIDLGSQSAVNILTTTDVMGEIDANTVAANAVRSAWGYRTQGTNFQNEARMKRATASTINPVGSAATTLLGESGRVASSWYSLNKAGAFDTMKANMSDDPIYSMGESRGWWEK